MPSLKNIALIAILAAPLAAPSLAMAEAKPLSALAITQPGDTELSCEALVQEAHAMRQVIASTQAMQEDKKLQSTGVGAAGAVGSFLLGTVTGGIGLAAAGYMINHQMDEKVEKIEIVQDKARGRRALMVGIFQAKGCEGDIQAAMKDRPAKDLLQSVSEISVLEPASGTQKMAPIRYGSAERTAGTQHYIAAPVTAYPLRAEAEAAQPARKRYNP